MATLDLGAVERRCVDTKTAAKMLGVSTHEVKRLCDSRRLTWYVPPGTRKNWRKISVDSIRRYAKARGMPVVTDSVFTTVFGPQSILFLTTDSRAKVVRDFPVTLTHAPDLLTAGVLLATRLFDAVAIDLDEMSTSAASAVLRKMRELGMVAEAIGVAKDGFCEERRGDLLTFDTLARKE